VSRDKAKIFLDLYRSQARMGHARLLTYTDVVVAVGWPQSRARNIMPFLNALRDLCREQGVPDLRAIIVAAGTDLPSRKSFHQPFGTWADTPLDVDGVRALQVDILSGTWARD
jgi:hypothetical protein